ncbi:MAG: hypothetical protein ACK5U8_21825 [Deltaproteobacteria bacterium]
MTWSTRLLYFLLIPAMLIAAGVLGFYSIEAAQSFAETTEESIFESTLLLVDEKIDRLEQMVQAVESIAIEVERIGEGQRFLTKVLSEQNRQLGAGAAQPIQVPQGQKAGEQVR